MSKPALQLLISEQMWYTRKSAMTKQNTHIYWNSDNANSGSVLTALFHSALKFVTLPKQNLKLQKYHVSEVPTD
jgi:hypothetical protein